MNNKPISEMSPEELKSRREAGLKEAQQVHQSRPKNHVLIADAYMPKYPRNAPCYCGSGIKHKNCCSGFIRGEKVKMEEK